jgi:hypothetical protein
MVYESYVIHDCLVELCIPALCFAAADAHEELRNGMAAIPEVVRKSYKAFDEAAAAEPDQQNGRAEGPATLRSAFAPPGRPPGGQRTKLNGAERPLGT